MQQYRKKHCRVLSKLNNLAVNDLIFCHSPSLVFLVLSTEGMINCVVSSELQDKVLVV